MIKNIFSRILMLFALISAIATSVASCNAKEEQRPEIKTYEEAVVYFNDVFNVKEGWDKPFDVYPDNRLYVDLMNKQLCFAAKDGQQSLMWEYTDVSSTTKKVKDAETFLAWLMEYFKLEENDSLERLYVEIDVAEDYRKKIAESNVSDVDKVFSLIYNSLVGDPDRFISAYIDSEGRWTKIRYDQYAGRTLDKNKFLEAMASLNEGLLEGMDAYKFMVNNRILGRAETLPYCYWNFREDKFYVYPNGKYTLTLNRAQSDIQSFSNTIIENPDKVYVLVGEPEELRDLDSFYKDSVICLNLDADYLSQCRYVKPEEPRSWTGLILICCAIIFACGIGALLYLFRKKIGKFIKARTSKGKVDERSRREHGRASGFENDPDAAFLDRLSKVASSEQPSALEVLKLFDKHYKTRTRDTFQNLLSQKNDLDEKVAVLDAFVTKVQDDKLSVKSLLHEVDLLLQGKKSKYEETYDDEIAKMGTYAQKYHTFINLVSEGSVMEYLDSIREENESFPKVKTVSRLVKASKKSSSDPEKQLAAFLEEADPSMYALYHSLAEDAKAYERIGKIFRSNDTGLPHDRYLQSLVDNALAMDDIATVNKYIEFALYFKASDEIADAQLTNVANAAREKYAAVDAALDGLVDASARIMARDTLNYWDRLSYFLALAETSKVLFKVSDQDYSDKISIAVEAFKNDILYLYMTRNFVINSKDKSVDAGYFENEIIGGKVISKVNEFNASCAPGSTMNLEDENIRACMAQCVEVIRKIRREEEMTEVLSLMWENFVKEYVEKVSANRDKGWLIASSVQIALYLADVLRYVIGGSEEYYCSNYAYLRTGELAGCDKDFSHNDYRYSDEFSNFIYSVLQEAGAADIDVIVNNFRIKM